VVYTGDKCGEELLAEYYAPIASASMMDMKVRHNEVLTITNNCVFKTKLFRIQYSYDLSLHKVLQEKQQSMAMLCHHLGMYRNSYNLYTDMYACL